MGSKAGSMRALVDGVSGAVSCGGAGQEFQRLDCKAAAGHLLGTVPALFSLCSIMHMHKPKIAL